MRCDIIVPVWNELAATKECVDSIVKNTAYPHKLIIVDNGSDRGTAGYLAGLKARADIDVNVIRNDENLGFARAVNQGILASDAQYVCIMNNDTIASPDWLEEMIKVFEGNPGIGILNPSSNTSGQKGSDPFCGQIQELHRARGFCMLIRREVIEKVGLFDESYGRGYFEETDYSYRAQAAGIRIARVKSAYVYHKEGLSFRRMSDKDELFNRNEKMFREKWGRSVRAGYFVDKAGAGEKINDIAINAARSGHQIWIFLKSGLEWPVKIDHFDIRRVNLSPFFFPLAAAWQILKRKKKKPLDIVMTDSVPFGNLVKKLNVLNDSDIVVNPDKDSLMDMLKEKSKFFQ